MGTHERAKIFASFFASRSFLPASQHFPVPSLRDIELGLTFCGRYGASRWDPTGVARVGDAASVTSSSVADIRMSLVGGRYM